VRYADFSSLESWECQHSKHSQQTHAADSADLRAQGGNRQTFEAEACAWLLITSESLAVDAVGVYGSRGKIVSVGLSNRAVPRGQSG
jgi:hypothetical protein